MTTRIGKSLELKWMFFLTLFTAAPLIIVGLSIVPIYHEGLKRSFVAVEGTILILGILFSYFFARKLALPIKRLSKGMEEVAKGSWDTHIEPYTQDEVGIVTESFNHMIQALTESKGALKEAEERYRKIFENLKDMVFINAADGKYIDVNLAGVKMLGYADKQELMQIRSVDTYLNADERKRYRNEIAKEGFVKDFEVKLKRKDGTPIDVLITSNAIKDDSGQVISYEGIIKDISDRKRMEEELVQRTRELEILYDMTSFVNRSLDLGTVLRTALERASSATGFDMGVIYLLNKEG